MHHLLTAVLYVPLLGAFVLATFPRERETWFKYGALFFSFVAFIISVALLSGFHPASRAHFQFVTVFSWVPQLGIQYKTGVDGSSLVLLLLTTLLSWISILWSCGAVTPRVNAY